MHGAVIGSLAAGVSVLLLVVISAVVTHCVWEPWEREGRVRDAVVAAAPARALANPRSWPATFLWGVATAAYQNEDGCVGNTWAMWSRSHCDDMPKSACGAWSAFERADLACADWLGCTAFRMSLDWGRIMPEPGVLCQAALRRYAAMVGAVRAAGMEPVITLCHFALPAWVTQDGWEEAAQGDGDPAQNRFVRHFTEYAVAAARALAPHKVRYWITLNEPVIDAINCYMRGARWPGKTDLRAALRAMKGMYRCHVASYGVLKRLCPGAQVSIAKNVAVLQPRRTWSPVDAALTTAFSEFYNHSFVEGCITGKLRLKLGGVTLESDDSAGGTLDYIGVNHYNVGHVGLKFKGGLDLAVDMAPMGVDTTQFNAMGWEMRPSSLMDAITMMYNRHRLPVMVTECGAPEHSHMRADEDRGRQAHVLAQMACMQSALALGILVLGVMWWTVTDNYEWTEGYEGSFGLFSVDRHALDQSLGALLKQKDERCCQQDGDGNWVRSGVFTPRGSAVVFRDFVARARGMVVDVDDDVNGGGAKHKQQ